MMLFTSAYVPNWYAQLDELAEMALPETWRFRNPIYLTKNPTTPILERYIHAIFKKQLIDYKEERNAEKAMEYFHIENEAACFHTGLYTPRYKAIFACFGRNKKKDSMLEWYFRGFDDELSPQLRYVTPLPKKPSYYMTQYGVNYNPEWPIRVNVDHILGDEENISRDPYHYGRVLFRQHLPHFRDGVSQCAVTLQTGGPVAHRYCGRRLRPYTPSSQLRHWRKGVLRFAPKQEGG